LSASILDADWSNLRAAVQEAERAGADSIHIDVMDGHYVHNLTFGIKLFRDLRPHTGLPLIAHLEINNPDDFITDFAEAGSDMIIVHEDTCLDLHATVHQIRAYNVKVGVALNPDRPLDALSNLLDRMDLLLIMSVYPGSGGQEFLDRVLRKVETARRLVAGLEYAPAIGMDGGINRHTIQACIRAGADFLVLGSALFRAGKLKDNLAELRSLTTAG